MSHPAPFLILALLALLTALPAASSGEGSRREPRARRPEDACEATCRGVPDSELESLIREVLGPSAGDYGVVVEHLERATGAGVNSDKLFEPASLFKLGIMHEVFRQREAGQLRVDERLTITARAASWDLGTLSSWGSIGQRVSIERLLEMMITISDNASAIMLADRIGWRRVDEGLQALGLHATRTTPPPQTTAQDMAVLLVAIARGKAVSPEASAAMQGLLLRQTNRDAIPAGVPEGVPVGNKTGNLPNATHDVAIVYAPSGTYVLAVLSDLPWTSAPILAVSRAVYTYYNGDNEDASRRLALRKIVRRPGTSALVDSEGRLLGLLSERDLLAWASSGGKELMASQELARRAEQDSVASLVSEETVTLDDSAPISAGIRAILEQQVDSLPVVKDGKVAGVVSSHDLLATLFEDEARAERPGGLDSFPVAAREEQHRLAGSLNGANGER